MSAQNRPEQSNLQQPYLARNSYITPNQALRGAQRYGKKGIPLTTETVIWRCGGKGVCLMLEFARLHCKLPTRDAQLLV